MDIAVLALLLLLVHAYTQPGSPAGVGWIKNWLITFSVPRALGLLLLLFIAKNLAGYLVQKAKFNFVYQVAARLSELNLLQYLEGNYHDYASTDSSVHIRRISQQPVEFGHYVLSGFQQVFSEVMMILLAVTAIILFDATLFLLLCIVLAPPLLLLSVYTKKRLSAVRGNIKISSEKALQHLKEALAGYIESNVYDKKDFLTERYSNRQQSLNKYLASLQSAQALPPRLMETFAVFGLLSLIALNELVRGAAVIPIVTIGAFLAAAYKIIPGLVKILNVSGQVKTYAFAAEGIARQHTVTANTDIAKQEAIHSVEIKNVFYNYNERQVLANFNLCAQSGEMVGLSGISGKGKTTLLNLLLGFLDPAQGQVIINKQFTSAAQRQQCWSNISYVKQQPFLVHDTILTNISLSMTKSGCSRQFMLQDWTRS
jgi:ABC-type multidrug transport system fused ATPase/permease subunit